MWNKPCSCKDKAKSAFCFATKITLWLSVLLTDKSSIFFPLSQKFYCFILLIRSVQCPSPMLIPSYLPLPAALSHLSERPLAQLWSLLEGVKVSEREISSSTHIVLFYFFSLWTIVASSPYKKKVTMLLLKVSLQKQSSTFYFNRSK